MLEWRCDGQELCSRTFVEEGAALHLAKAYCLGIVGGRRRLIALHLVGEAVAVLLRRLWVQGFGVGLRVSALASLLRGTLSVALSGVGPDGAATEPVVVVQSTSGQQYVLVFGRLRLLVDLLQDVHDVPGLALVVGIA
jgi:hypothetical protein